MKKNKEKESLFKKSGASEISKFRKQFHAAVLEHILTMENGVPSNADKSSPLSVALAKGIVDRIGKASERERLAGQTSGNKFENICRDFIQQTFLRLGHLRPGKWRFDLRGEISQYEQYSHLNYLDQIKKKDAKLASIIGSDYTITPDIVVAREPEEDVVINENSHMVDEQNGKYAGLRKKNSPLLLLHASISCKWTIRSDRAQNSRTEALNLMRNRKGKLPHIMVITGEPTPGRLASIALGTGDIDCVYHFALRELLETAKEMTRRNKAFADSNDLLQAMVDGKRLRDISDLSLDLAI